MVCIGRDLRDNLVPPSPAMDRDRFQYPSSSHKLTSKAKNSINIVVPAITLNFRAE